jgi:acetoin utilization protein AcuB
VLVSGSDCCRKIREKEKVMKVKSWMSGDVHTITPDLPISEAVRIMTSRSIRHLPVVDQGEMIGLVTESNIRQYLSQPVDDVIIEDIMIVNPITIDINASIDSAAKLIHAYKIGCLPVLEKRKLAGIITTIDILAAFIELMGILEESSRIDVVVNENIGSIEDVMKIIRHNGGTVISVGLDAGSSHKRMYYIRLRKTGLEDIINAVNEAGHKVAAIVD